MKVIKTNESKTECEHPKESVVELYQIDEWPYPSYIKVKCLKCGELLDVELPQ